jgi:hypothetical protein
MKANESKAPADKSIPFGAPGFDWNAWAKNRAGAAETFNYGDDPTIAYPGACPLITTR